MYAIKKNINKVLAAFLCACLLLSYNPAFGTTGTAWAAEGDEFTPITGAPYAPTGTNTDDDLGDATKRNVDLTAEDGSNTILGSDGASTIIQASTFTSELQVNMTPGPLFGTVEQIKDYEGATYPIIVEATCSETNSLGDYTFEWKVTANGTSMTEDELAIINDYMSTPSFNNTTNVAKVELDLKRLMTNNPTLFKNDIKYEFTCDVTMSATEPAQTESPSVTLFTIDQSGEKSSYSNHRLEDGRDPIPVVATGDFLTTAKLLTQPSAANLESVLGGFSQEATRGTTEYEKFDLLYGENNQPEGIYDVSIAGGLEVNENLTLPPTNGGPYNLYFPIDEDYVYDATENPTGYKEGELITVLWKVRNTGLTDDLVTMKAELVRDTPVADGGTGKLMAVVTFNPAESTADRYPRVDAKNANGADQSYVNKAENPNGQFFTLVYSSNKTKPGKDDITYYSVSATVSEADQHNGNSLQGLGVVSSLTMDGTPVYVRTGTDIKIEVLPQTALTDDYNAHRYQLKSLWFKDAPDATPIDLVKNKVEGLTLDAAQSCIWLAQPLCDRYYSKYFFEAEFEEVPNDLANGAWSLHADVVDADTYNPDTDSYAGSTNGLVTASYTRLNENKQQTVQGTKLENIPVRHGGYANLSFMAKAGIETTNFEIKGVETSLTGEKGTWAPAAWLPGFSLTIPHMTSNMHVRVLVGATNSPVTQPTYYNVTIKPADGTDERCKVSPEAAIVPANSGSPFDGISFNMIGVTDKVNGGFYAASYTVTEGGNAPVTVDLLNDEKKDTGTLTRTYMPSDDVLKGALKGDILIEVAFKTTNPTPRQLTLKVSGSGGKATVVNAGAPDANGAYTIGSNEPFSVLMVPDNGYQVSGLVVKGDAYGEKRPGRDDPSIYKTGVYNGKMPDEDITVTVVFNRIDSSVNLKGNRNVSIYVADANLKDDADTKYIWESTEPVLDSSNAEMPEADITAPTDGIYRGYVNNSTILENMTLSLSDPYIMNFRGKYWDDHQYAVSKVLVVPYHLEGEPGNQTKVADSLTLYPWDSPTFELNYRTWNTKPNVDVIVYFDEVDLENGGHLNQPAPDDYVKVDIHDDRQILRDTLQPKMPTEVLPGGYLTITGMKLKDDWEWGGEDGEPAVTVNGKEISADQLKQLEDTGVLVIGPMPAGGQVNIELGAHWVEPIIIPENMEVSAENPDDREEPFPGEVYATVKSTGETLGPISYFDGPAELPTLTMFDLGFKPNNGYRLTNVAFKVSPFQDPDDPTGKNMRAWVKKNAGTGGEDYNSLVFQATQPAGYEPYDYTTTPSIEIEKGDATMWRVEGLLGNMTVLTTFEEIPPIEDPNDEAWSVKAGITNGKGVLYMTYDGVRYGNQVNVPKGSSKSVTINTAPAVGYELASVMVKTSTDNFWVNLWHGITGANVTNMTQDVKANGGTLLIVPVDRDYQISVEYKNTDPNMLDTETIPVNVYGDTNKGTVKPNTNVRANRTGMPQFTIDVNSLYDEDGKEWFYSIDSLKVTPHYTNASGDVAAANTVTIPAGQATSDGVIEWGKDNVVFTVNIDKVAELPGVPTKPALSAVDVEVVYGPANLEVKPIPDVSYGMKQVTILSSTGGGVISPLGTYEIYPYKVDTSSNGWAKFLVVVSPAEGYGLSGLSVSRYGASDATNAALANDYMQQLSGESSSSSGCFYIEADPSNPSTMSDEVINIQFEQLYTSDKTYTIHMRAVVEEGAAGTVVTQKDVTLPLNESFSYSVNTSGSNVGIQVTDKYSPTGGTTDTYTNGYNVPDSAAVTPDKLPIVRTHNNNCLTVNPAMIMNRVVDRWITVTFKKLPAEGLTDADRVVPINNNEKATIKVNVYSAEGDESSDELNITPRASLNNILRSEDSHYLYNWWFDEGGDQRNYYVYCVKVNGVTLPGYSDVATTAGLKKSGSYLFDWNTLKNGTNTLDIYTGTYLNGVVNDPGMSGGDIVVDWGEGGWVLNAGTGNLAGTGSGSFGSLSSWLSAFGSASGAELDETIHPAGSLEDEGNGEDNPGTTGDNSGNTGDNSGTTGDNSGTTGDNSGTSGTTPSGTTGEGSDGSINTNPVGPSNPANMVKTYTIVPSPGYVIDHVYLYNCHAYPVDNPAISWVWTTPSNALSSEYRDLFGPSWSKKIVLNYTLELDEPDTTGYMYASFEYKGTNNIGDMNTWDPTDEGHYDILGKDNLSVHFYPYDHAKAIAPLIHANGISVEYLHEGSQGQDGTVALRGHTEDKGDRYIATYSTLEDIAPNDMFTFRVGPLLPEDGSADMANKLYTLDVAEMKKSMPNVSVTPVVPSAATLQSLAYNADRAELASGENDGVATQADDTAKYYRYYTVKGSAAALGLDAKKNLTLQLPLQKLTADSGDFPELPSLQKTGNTSYQVSAAVSGEGGSIVPTSTTVVGSWANGSSGPWTVASGTRVAFSVVANENYLLDELWVNDSNVLLNRANGYYDGDGQSGILTVPVYANTAIIAKFTSKSSQGSVRKISISVQGGHGTTFPEPGTYEVEKGQPYSIQFSPESGYVPYRIWVDGVESFVNPSLTGWPLPASWNDQTFRVQYALEGTVPSNWGYFTQASQNAVTDLARTGNSPIVILCVVGVAALAAVGVWQVRRRKAASARVVKYSVTKRK